MARMKRLYDVVATVGKYTDAAGQEKYRYQNCGAVFAKTLPNGDTVRVIKLEAMPVGRDFDGWFNCYPVKEKGGQEA